MKEKRRKCGRKRRPLPPLRKGADQAWKEFKVVYFYDEDLQHQHVAVTHQNHEAAGRLLRREADRLDFRQASERIANVDGAPWIREQLQLHLAELDGLGLDFYHLERERASRAARRVRRESRRRQSVGGRADARVQARRLRRRPGSAWSSGAPGSAVRRENAERRIAC